MVSLAIGGEKNSQNFFSHINKPIFIFPRRENFGFQRAIVGKLETLLCLSDFVPRNILADIIAVASRIEILQFDEGASLVKVVARSRWKVGDVHVVQDMQPQDL